MRSQRILDIGCGSGALLESLASRGYSDLCGVDITPPARSNNFRFETCDLDYFRLDHEAETFDLLLAIEVIEHIENPGLWLQEVRRLLKPNGSILISTPNIHSLEARIRYFLLGKLKQFDDKGDPTHISPVFTYCFRKLAQRHGLEVYEAWGFPENGFSPTSRPALRVLTSLLMLAGMKGSPGGDILFMNLRLCSNPISESAKSTMLTAHYAQTPSNTKQQ